MGWFSEEEVHEYTPYSCLLFAEAPPLIKQTVLFSILSNRNIAEDLRTNLIYGNVAKLNSYWRQAEKDDHPWGLPQSNISMYNHTTTLQMEAVLQEELGKDISVSSMKVMRNSLGEGYTYTVYYYSVNELGEVSTEQSIWTYDTDSGKYPILDREVKHDNTTPYYPITPLRVNGVDLGKEGAEYESVIRKAFRPLGLSTAIYDQFEAASQESGQGGAEDIFIVLGTSITTKVKPSKQYIYHFFKRMAAEVANGGTANDLKQWEADDNATSPPPLTELTISDSQYKQILRWSYITCEIINKKIEKNKIGDCVISAATFGEISKLLDGILYSSDQLIIEYQITKTQVERVTVGGLNTLFAMNGSGGYKGVSLEDAFSEPDSALGGGCFFIPLRKDIVRDMGVIAGHDLINNSLRLHSNDHSVYVKEWYETGIFQVLLLIANIALTIVTGGASGALLAAQIAMTVFFTVAIPMVIQMLLVPLLVDVFGEEVAFYITVAIQIALSFINPSAAAESLVSTVTTATTKTANAVVNMSAQTLVNAGMQLSSAVAQFSIQKDYQKIAQASEQLQEEIKAFEEEQLNNEILLDVIQNGIKSDSFKLREPHNYVRRVLIEPYYPLMITSTVDAFVSSKMALDTPTSALKTGH